VHDSLLVAYTRLKENPRHLRDGGSLSQIFLPVKAL
jgi:hypothetical protein